MSDTPPPAEPCRRRARADRRRRRAGPRHVENAAHAVFIAALLWYALHGDEEPADQSLLRKSARRLGPCPVVGSTPPVGHEAPSTATARAGRVDRRNRPSRSSRSRSDDAGAHYDTVFKRMRRDDPKVSDTTVSADVQASTTPGRGRRPARRRPASRRKRRSTCNPMWRRSPGSRTI